MSLASIVSVSISASSKTPTRLGFGTPLIAACKVPAAWGSALVRTFGGLDEIVAAGFAVTDPAYLAAAVVKSANPAPKLIKIGKRTKPTKLVKLTVTDATEGRKYEFRVGTTDISYTVLASATTTTVAAALAALIDADAAVAATSALAVITCTAASGVLFDVRGWYACDMTLKDETGDPGIAADLALFAIADKDWYGLIGDNFGKAENIAAATWCEANKKLFAADTADTEVADPLDTDDCASTAKASTLARSGYFTSNAALMHFTGAGMYGAAFPQPIGSLTWKFKSLPGVPVSTWKEGEKTAIFAKNANTYTDVGGLNISENGKTASGEWFDVVHFLDWLESEIKVRVFAALANAPKIPYTDKGVGLVASVIEGTLADGVKVGGLAADPEPSVTAPAVADVDSVTRAGRLLPNVTFAGRLAGAIHQLEIAGTLSV